MHKRLLSLVALTACFAAACGGTTSEADQPQDNDASLSDGQAGATQDSSAQETASEATADDVQSGEPAEEAAPADGDLPDSSDAEPVDQGLPDVVVDSDGVTCGSTTCAPGLLCCASMVDGGASFECAAQCPDGGAPMECDGPEDCGGGNCCVQINVGAGSPPNCPIETAGATCKADCPTQIPMSCPAQGQGQLCHTNTDCSDPQNPVCCSFQQGGVSATFCVSSLIAQVVGCN